MRKLGRPLVRTIVIWSAIVGVSANEGLAGRFAVRRQPACDCHQSKAGKGGKGNKSSGPYFAAPQSVGSSSDFPAPTPPAIGGGGSQAAERQPPPQPPTEAPSQSQQDPPPPAPATDDTPPPAPAEPANPLENLFGDPDPVPPAPADDSADDNPLDGLFGDPVPETNPEIPPPGDDPLEGLFGDPDAGAALLPLDLQEVFAGTGEVRVSHTRPARRPLEVRKWVDKSSLFSVSGELVELFEGRVRIRKAAGGTCTIAVDQLSDADRTYVSSVRSRFVADGHLQLTGE